MLQVCFRLSDHTRNRFHALAQIRNALLRCVEVAHNQKVKTVGEALIVNQRVPIRFLEFFQFENLIVDVVAQDANIHLVCAGQLRNGLEFVELFPELPGARKQSITRFRRVIPQLIVKAMIAQFRGVLGLRREEPLNVIVRNFLKLIVLWGRASVAERQSKRHCECDCDCFHKSINQARRWPESARSPVPRNAPEIASKFGRDKTSRRRRRRPPRSTLIRQRKGSIAGRSFSPSRPDCE